MGVQMEVPEDDATWLVEMVEDATNLHNALVLSL
jgi:hypothetical protein